MSGSIRFLLGDRLIEASDFDPQSTVLNWLREQRRTGTKEGCAEGDCGACTVVVGDLEGDGIRYRSFNACIQLLATLDGRQLITVEDLARDGLHPVQQAMVDQHGSQCGFCTPGFVMSLFAMYHQDRDGGAHPPLRRQIDEALAGNLCRCTGYAPIARAAGQALSRPADDHYSRNLERTVARLKEIQRDHGLELEHGGRRFFAPRGMDELCSLLARHPEAVIVAGATDVGLWITKQLRVMDTLVYTGHVAELQALAVDRASACLEIGAAVSYTDAMGALVDAWPEFHPLLARLGAVQVRNAGTIGGNIANGSPIGDMPPPLIALGARILLRSAQGHRTIDLEDFYIEYGKQDLGPGECIEKVVLPLPAPAQQFRVYKLGKRFDQDISAVCAAFALTRPGEAVDSIRICYGGMAGVPARAKHAESALQGQPWTQATVTRAMSELERDFEPITDWRASREYRMLSAQNLLQRFFLETTGGEPVQLLAAGSRP
jgi:xanthine dehydrogenase small subunit